MKEEVVYDGNLFQVLHRTKQSTFRVGENEISKTIQYELVRRPPGVRAIIVNQAQILLTHEFRYELDRWDYRLPGGKIYDSNKEYQISRQNYSLDSDIVKKLKQEIREETGIDIKKYRKINVSQSGLTVEWDLHYFVIYDFTLQESKTVQKSEYEFIEHKWVDFSTALNLCLDGMISESRSAFEIMRFILNNN